MIPVRHSGGPLGLTLTMTPGMADSGMADPRNGGPPQWGPVRLGLGLGSAFVVGVFFLAGKIL